MEIFARRLKELRAEKKLSMRAVARFLEISQPAYFRYEKNMAEPSQEILVKLADYFGVTVDFLLGRVDY